MTAEELAAAIAQIGPEDRSRLVAALLAGEKPAAAQPAVPSEPPEPPPERVTNANFSMQPGPGMTGSLEDPMPDSGTEPRDTPDHRARLLALLAANPSGLPGYALLDQHRIPPETIDLARREGQVGRAERGLGLTHEWGGPWARDTENIDMAAVERYQKMFKERLQLA